MSEEQKLRARMEFLSAITSGTLVELLNALGAKAVCYVLIDADGTFAGGGVVNTTLCEARSESVADWATLVQVVGGRIIEEIEATQRQIDAEGRPNID